MKKLFIALVLLSATFASTSCRDKKTETKEVKVIHEVEVDKKEEPKEGILERTAKEVDKEVNQEIDKKIDDIGNDEK